MGPRSEQEAIAAKLAAERAAREAEEARKREIMRQIKTLEDERDECESLIGSFSSLQAQVQASSIQLGNLKIRAMHPEMGLFSGVTAAATEEGISNVAESLAVKAGVISEVAAAIGSQIGMLHSHIMELNSRISSLKAGL